MMDYVSEHKLEAVVCVEKYSDWEKSNEKTQQNKSQYLDIKQCINNV